MNIGVIGNGVVGNATARTYLEYAKEVRVWDILPQKSTHSLLDTLKCDIVFVCIPEDKVDSLFSSLSEGIREWTCFVLRSTVPIGTTKRIANEYKIRNIVHSPEFLTARCAEVDARIPSRNIIGGVDWGYGNPCKMRLEEIYKNRFPGTSLLLMSSNESEMVKLMCNAFFAVKVAFFNEANTLCTKLGLEWNSIIEGVLSDGRIAPYHYHVPGPDGQYGFGGACLVKDLTQFNKHIEENYALPEATTICRAALLRNTIDREKK
jgi:UDPglucose 6-dehydrogenase